MGKHLPPPFSGDTELDFSLGSYHFSNKLADDPAWKAGAKSAQWVMRVGTGTAKMRVSASWNARLLTLTATCSDAGAAHLLHATFDGWAGPNEQTALFTVAFGSPHGAAIGAIGVGTRTLYRSDSTHGLTLYRVHQHRAFRAPRPPR